MAAQKSNTGGNVKQRSINLNDSDYAILTGYAERENLSNSAGLSKLLRIWRDTYSLPVAAPIRQPDNNLNDTDPISAGNAAEAASGEHITLKKNPEPTVIPSETAGSFPVKDGKVRPQRVKSDDLLLDVERD